MTKNEVFNLAKDLENKIINNETKYKIAYITFDDGPYHSTDQVLDILKKYKVKGIIHCFSGSKEIAKEFIKYGYKLGIGGVLTFKNSKLYEVINEFDLSNFVLETDSPYLSPEPFRGKQNKPSNFYFVAKRISEIKGISIDEVINKTSENKFNIQN